jgi:hypothetical protein
MAVQSNFEKLNHACDSGLGQHLRRSIIAIRYLPFLADGKWPSREVRHANQASLKQSFIPCSSAHLNDRCEATSSSGFIPALGRIRLRASGREL